MGGRKRGMEGRKNGGVQGRSGRWMSSLGSFMVHAIFRILDLLLFAGKTADSVVL